jgi:hypothetical protein
MGAGFAQVGMLLLLTVVGLPLFFFGLMAALDLFERSLSTRPRAAVPRGVASAAPAGTPADVSDATVVALPIAPAPLPAVDTTAAAATAAATTAATAGKPAAAI